ncbi:DUF4186 domain-containing protein [Planctomycetota bacterium]
MKDTDELFTALAKSKFRSRFRLRPKEADYLKRKGLSVVLGDARKFITERLAPAEPANNGRQTPTKNHPVFIAQHATATCCRKCLAKWHKIPQEKKLTDQQIDYIITFIERWLKKQRV